MSAIGSSIFEDKKLYIKDLYISEQMISVKKGMFYYSVENLSILLNTHQKRLTKVLMADYILPKEVFCYLEFSGKVFPVCLQ